MSITVKPWGKGGRRRLYVSDADTGATIGWVDPDTYAGHIAVYSRYLEYCAVLAKNFRIPSSALQKIVRDSRPTPNRDLSLNKPGAKALAKAQESHARMGRRMGATEEQTWMQGAEGERLVGEMLSLKLPRNWHVLHAVPIGTEDSDIDQY